MNLLCLWSVLTAFVPLPEVVYDPSKTSGKVTTLDAEFRYGDENRKVPLRIYLPHSQSKSPVILFSHGLGGSRENNPYLGNHWAGRGYVVVFMQHAGSDNKVWKDVPWRDRLEKMKSAASASSFRGRTSDVTATLDQLEKWNVSHDKLKGRMNLKKIGMSGHSFGAVTTQALSGQNYGRRGQAFTDKRIKAAVAMSPSIPQFGNNKETFAKVKIPWLLMTGTKDKSIISRTTPEDRQKVFQQLPDSGDFFQLVLHDGEHMAFSERKLSGGKHRNPNHHKVILALSTAFWDSYLMKNEAASKWLKGDSPRGILEKNDKWQLK